MALKEFRVQPSKLASASAAVIGLIGLVGSTSAAIAQTPSSSAGDVVVDTEPQQPSSTTPPTPTQTASGTRFSCEVVNGQYTVMYRPESQPGQAYAWANPSALGGGWSPERRCTEISRRLESYRPDGLLEMRTDVENGYNTVCVTTQNVPACRIVLTVPPGQDPLTTRDRVFQNLTIADSGQQTQAVNTFRGNDGNILSELGRALNIKLPRLGGSATATSTAINLRPFLDRYDGGTAALLKKKASRPGVRMNPDRFR